VPAALVNVEIELPLASSAPPVRLISQRQWERVPQVRPPNRVPMARHVLQRCATHPGVTPQRDHVHDTLRSPNVTQ